MMESHLNSCTTNSSSTSSITNFFLSGSDPFESAFSSMVSSPTATATAISINPPGHANLLMDLINRRFCNSNSNSPSPSPSCHITPLNSPPHLPGLSTPFPADPDPGFPLRAARFSPFPNPNPIAVQESRDGLSTPENVELTDSRDNSSISDLIPLPLPNSRKRKSIIPKGIQTPSPSPCVKEAHQVESGITESGAKKRSKAEDGSEKAKTKASSKSSEPPKDYIHVRARRGQATDAHSLAERVRREKITERMKFLQDLVPGCNKVTGKAVMLDEIINYVQSLQRQVEFLSMKLSTVNPRMEEMNMEVVASSSKDVFECHGGSLPYHNLYQQQSNPLESYHEYFHSHPQNNGGASNHGSRAGLLARGRNQGALHLQVPLVVDNYSETTANVNATQVSTALWEDDLQSFVQMGFGQNMQRASSNSGHGRGIQMKVEL